MFLGELNAPTICIELVAECYANKAFAYELSRVLESAGYRATVKHTSKSGRDLIISKVLREQSQHLRICVMDYERGVSRVYIDRNFELQEIGGLTGQYRVLIGYYKSKRNVLAIVFDPDIENALLCKASEDLCRDPSKLRRVKSENGFIIVRRIIEDSDNVKKVLYLISQELLRKIQDVSGSG